MGFSISLWRITQDKRGRGGGREREICFEKFLNKPFNTRGADAPIRRAGHFTRTRYLEHFRKIEINTEIPECGRTHPQCESVTRTRDLDRFWKMQFTQKNSSVRTHSSAVRVTSPALGFLATFQKNSEPSADALDSSAGRPPALRT